ncbi:MAG TPA: hypothetical protein VKZ49_09470 [Polyangiaceae bacterium]|nr:hypothetical protein [Polyangiaceae bacterium]
MTSAAAAPRPKVVVEIGARAERLLDARFTRRMIDLELGEVEVPGLIAARPATLFYRVLHSRQGEIRVELWERGQFLGARSVSAKGSAQLRARRVALAAAELGRRVRQRRLFEERVRQEAALQELREAERLAAAPRFSGEITAGAQAALIGTADAWLAGPRLGLSWGIDPGPSASVWSSLMIGSRERDGAAEWLEVGLYPNYSLRLAPAARLRLGLAAAAASVHLTDAAAVDGVDGQSDSWTARAAARIAYEARVGSSSALSVAADAGLLLRPIPITAEGARERQHLEGSWLSLSFEWQFEALRAQLAPRSADSRSR